MHHQAYFSPYFQTKRLAIGYKEVPRRKPQLRDASCGTSQGFFLTQDTSPMALDYPSEQHWMPRFKPANPSVGNSNNHDNCQNKDSDGKHDSPKDEDESEKIKAVRFLEAHQNQSVEGHVNISDGTKFSTSPQYKEEDTPNRNSEKKDANDTKVKPQWLSSERQKTYITDKEQSISYVPSFQSDKRDQSNNNKISRMPQRRQKAQDYQFHNPTRDYGPSQAGVQPQQEEYQAYGVKYC